MPRHRRTKCTEIWRQGGLGSTTQGGAVPPYRARSPHMARAGGGKWKDPDARMLDGIREEEKKRIEQLKAKVVCDRSSSSRDSSKGAFFARSAPTYAGPSKGSLSTVTSTAPDAKPL